MKRRIEREGREREGHVGSNYMFWPSTANGSLHSVQNFVLQRLRYETKQILVWIREKNRVREISYRNWVWLMRFELWFMDDAQSK